MGSASTRDKSKKTFELTRSARALAFARRAHAGQRRKQTGGEFIEHSIEVAELLADAGFAGELIDAAFLHDVVEKTAVELDEVRAEFGDRVAELVGTLTEDPSLPGYAARKRALRRRVLAAGGDTVLIYAADRVANMRDWRTVAPTRRERVAGRLDTTLEVRLQLWLEDLAELSAHDPGLPFLAEIELELGELRVDP